jgi:putative transposase
MAVRRIFSSLSVLKSLKSKGYKVGRLKWKSPREYRSIVFNQSGFDVDDNTGRTEHATLELSKLGTIDVDYHRPLPDDGTIKEIRLKEEKSGKWYASIVVDHDPDYPDKLAVEDISLEDTVGIDLGILKFAHDSDGNAVTPLDESEDRERIEKRHRALSRKQRGSNNWEKNRVKLAEAYERLSNKREDFIEKLAHSYTTQYSAVFLEKLNVRGMLEQDSNGRNIAAMSWSETIKTFERHGDKNGCHVVTVPPEGTTKRCALCDVESAKAIWVREHSCPSCGFEADRDENASYNVQKLGLEELGIEYDGDVVVGLGETELTPAETALPTGASESDDSSFRVVPAKRVVETGSHGSPDPW